MNLSKWKLETTGVQKFSRMQNSVIRQPFGLFRGDKRRPLAIAQSFYQRPTQTSHDREIAHHEQSHNVRALASKSPPVPVFPRWKTISIFPSSFMAPDFILSIGKYCTIYVVIATNYEFNEQTPTNTRELCAAYLSHCYIINYDLNAA